MEKPIDIRKMFKITQQDMATLLGLSRSHYSMFESGKRALPLSAMQKMATLLATANATPVSAKQSQAQAKQQILEKKRELNNLLRENEYQQALISRKIALIKNNNTTSILRQALIDNLQKMDATKQSKTVVDRITNASLHDQSTALLKLEIRAEVLQFEKSLLQKRLKAR